MSCIDPVFEEVLSIFAERGTTAYFGESVSMTEHALQAAHFAAGDGAAPALIIAALLHDVGHLVEPAALNIADWEFDAHHEEIGSRWLAKRFPAEISEPVRLHVPAKRYLCAVDPAYSLNLSAASLLTLKLQGGPMSTGELSGFEAEPHHRAAIKVRQWDDRGKVPGLVTPQVTDYRGMLQSLAQRY